MTLNAQQAAAVYHRGSNLAVLSVAGSGKTRVMIHRAAELIREGTPPDRILLLTYTRTAAQNMRGRIESMVTSAPQASTFHSYALSVLRTYARQKLLKFLTKAHDWLEEVWAKHVVEEIGLAYTVEDISKIVATHAYKGIHPDRPELSPIDTNPIHAAICKEYAQVKRAAGWMSFDDIIVELLHLLRENTTGVANDMADRFDHVLVDEYQDTTPAQALLLEYLCHADNPTDSRACWEPSAHLTAVGDDDQSIFSFAGGSPEGLIDFEKRWGGTAYKLETNYRSGSAILTLANALIGKNTGRVLKTLRPKENAHNATVTVVKTNMEPSAIASLVQAKMTAGHDPGEIVVLYRTNGQAGAIEFALAERKIPYYTYGDNEGFFGRTEVKVLLSYMRAATRSHDVRSLEYVMNRPSRYVKKTAIAQAIATAGINSSVSTILADMAGSDGSSRSLVQAARAIQDILEVIKPHSGTEIFDHLVERLDYQTYLTSLNRLGRRSVLDMWTAVRSIRNMIRKSGSVSSFLDRVDQIIDRNKSSTAAAGKVSLMTIHKSKGLEFDDVILSGVTEGMFPHGKSTLDEERRLLYVAVTRARKFFVAMVDVTEGPSLFAEEMIAAGAPVKMKIKEPENNADA